MKTAKLDNYKVPTGEQLAKKIAANYWERFYMLRTKADKWTPDEAKEFVRLKGLLKVIGGRV